MTSISVLQIALPVPLYQKFDYLAPADSRFEKIKTGTRASVLFGNRKLIGIIIGKSNSSAFPKHKLKTVIEILDNQPIFDSALYKLLLWATRYYQQPIGEVFSSALPKVMRQGGEIAPAYNTIYILNDSDTDEVSLKHAPKQRFLYEFIKTHPEGVGEKSLKNKIHNWRTLTNELIKKKLILKKQSEEPDQKKSLIGKLKRITLNNEQKYAYEILSKNIHCFNTYVIVGVTGSGKTEVYLKIAKDVLRNQKQVLFLVPEIGLTQQLVERVETRLGIHASLMHSGLNDSERAQTWLATKTGKTKVVVGTRSATFLPFNQLGLIIVDEEHDMSFKQQDGFLYQGRDIAIYRAKQLNIPIILGSATPSFESLKNINAGKYQKLVLQRRAKNTSVPKVKLIDMRSKSVREGLSSELLQEMKIELSNGHQVLLFLNRRGYAPTMLCQECGWIAECARCDARMTFYKNKNILKCHHCFKEQVAPSICSHCGSEKLLFLGEGTQRIEKILKEIFPDYAIARIDRDSTRRKNTLQSKLDNIHNEKYKIIIGTQMISKGHDFPGVTLVGILNVDHGLFSTDFRATERLAQLIVQVAGRAGRSKIKGKVLLQTYQPEHHLLNCLLNKGYEAFSEEALAIRKNYDMPPYTFITIIRARASKYETAQRFLESVKDSVLVNPSSKLTIIGPIPATLERKAGMYQSHLIVTSPYRSILQESFNDWAIGIQKHRQSKNVRWNIEVDPLDLE